MLLSIVITSYNRCNDVCNAIDSVTEAFKAVDFEIVLVDDESQDGTIEYLKERFESLIAQKVLKLFRNERNLGVTGTKNQGFTMSKGDWTIFLDSDDLIVPTAGKDMYTCLEKYNEHPIIFFRCVDQDGAFVGKRFESDQVLDIKTYLKHTSYGEALTAVNHQLVKEPPYVTELRGYEGVGCSRIIVNYGEAILSKIIGRVYITESSDRLSSKKGFLKRTTLLAKGNMMMIREFGAYMSLSDKLMILAKTIIYYVVGSLYNIKK